MWNIWKMWLLQWISTVDTWLLPKYIIEMDQKHAEDFDLKLLHSKGGAHQSPGNSKIFKYEVWTTDESIAKELDLKTKSIRYGNVNRVVNFTVIWATLWSRLPTKLSPVPIVILFQKTEGQYLRCYVSDHRWQSGIWRMPALAPRGTRLLWAR